MPNNNLKAWQTRRVLYGRNGHSIIPDRLPWCPHEYRERYQFYRSTKRLGAVEARRIVEEEMSRARS